MAPFSQIGEPPQNPGRFRLLSQADFSWVPISQVIQGESVLHRWSQLAKDSTVYDCRPLGANVMEVCTQLVFAWSEVNQQTENGIAACSVVRTKLLTTPPAKCRFIAVTRKPEALILAATSFQIHVYGMAGRTDFTIEIDNFPEKNKANTLNALYSTLRKALESKLLGLNSMWDGEDVLGVSDFRYSNALGRWTRETVRIGLYDWDSQNGAPKLSIATTLYVSSQNSSETKDWHLPSEQESTVYIQLVKDSLKRYLPSICPGGQGQWIDNLHENRVVCGSDMPIPQEIR